MPYTESMNYDRSCTCLVLYMILLVVVLLLVKFQMGEACALERRDMA